MNTNISNIQPMLALPPALRRLLLAAGMAAFVAAASAQSPAPALKGEALAWDADAKEYNAKTNELTAPFTFYVTNTSPDVVIFHSVVGGCGCTEARLPEQPWRLAPGASGPITATMNLRYRSGRVSKPVTVNTSVGAKTLTINVNIPAASVAAGAFAVDQTRPVQPTGPRN